MAPLHVELVAADREVWSGDASMVSARSIEGDMGILPGHEPTLVVLGEGEVRIQGEGGTQTVQIDGGFLSVDSDRVTIVSETVDESGLTR